MCLQERILSRSGPLDPYAQAFGITESPRGENIHWIMTGEDGNIFRYKIRTPSFCKLACALLCGGG